VSPDQVNELREYESQRQLLMDDPFHVLVTPPITSLEQQDWVIRASVMRNNLSANERDYLEKRLHVTLEELFESPYATLVEALRITQLLDVIGRPINRDQYRDRIHDLLRKFHDKDGGGFQAAGGFGTYLSSPAGSLPETAYAIELMEIYGPPRDLDLNWVRSYLRPSAVTVTESKMIAAVALDRLNRLPGAAQPSWLDYLYYERSLIMALLLVSLCIYAAYTSPRVRLPRGRLELAVASPSRARFGHIDRSNEARARFFNVVGYEVKNHGRKESGTAEHEGKRSLGRGVPVIRRDRGISGGRRPEGFGSRRQGGGVRGVAFRRG